jgi:hypothetical protein
MPRTVQALLRLVPRWLPAVALLAVPGAATAHALAAPLEIGYRLTFAGSAVWRQPQEAGTAYSASAGKTVYTARFTWTFVFPTQWFKGHLLGLPSIYPGTGSWVHGGWTTVVGHGGPPVESGCANVTFRLVASREAIYGFPRGGHPGLDAEVPTPGSLIVTWKSGCDNPFDVPPYTSTSKCPPSADLRYYEFIPWNLRASSVPPANESAAFSVTCDTGHATDVLAFPMVDNYLHWSGTVGLTRLST